MKKLPARDRAVTGAHERLCDTTGTTGITAPTTTPVHDQIG